MTLLSYASCTLVSEASIANEYSNRWLQLLVVFSIVFCTLLIGLFKVKHACNEKSILDLTSECFVILKVSSKTC